MTDFYCDHGAYASALGTTPTWGVPQEGDGSTKDAATASSVASIDLTSITSTAGTFSLFGSAAVSVGAGASGATLAAQIVAAINGSSASTGNTTIFPGAPQLRNAFFARNTGAVLEIMCRIGSATTNVLGMTWAGTWSAGPPSNLTFAGGSGGCWGWFWNGAALGVSSSITLGGYGCFIYLPYAGTKPTEVDRTIVRTGAGVSITIVCTTEAYQRGAFNNHIVFDTNTVWTSDTGLQSVVVNISQTSNTPASIRLAAGYSVSFVALRRGGFEFNINCVTSNGFGGFQLMAAVSVASTYCYGKNLVFKDTATGNAPTANLVFGSAGTNSKNYFVWEDCDYVVTTPRTAINYSPVTLGQGYGCNFLFNGCTFDFNISGAADPGGVITGNNNTNYEAHLSVKNCQFLGYAPKYKAFSSMGTVITGGNWVTCVIENCSGIKLPGAYAGVTTASIWFDPNIHTFMQSDEVEGMRIENTMGVAEWIPTESPAFPTLSASRPGSGVPWSLRLVWFQLSNPTKGRPFVSPPLRMYTQLAAATRVLTLQLFLPSTVTSGISVVFGYVDNTGIPRTQSVFAISSSAATWTNSASFSGYVAKQMSVITDYPIAANSSITCEVIFSELPPTSVVNVYVDPEFTVV